VDEQAHVTTAACLAAPAPDLLPESDIPSVKTPDYEMMSEERRAAVVEVKQLGRVPRTAENGWRLDESTGFSTRTDNGAARVGAAIHRAYKQLSRFAEPKVLVFVNDDSMDFLDLREALQGYLLYGTDEVGFFRNDAGRRVSEGTIREEKLTIDLYVWINRYESRLPSGRKRSVAVSGGARPTRAAVARREPSGRPTHHVATTPQNKPRTVGESDWMRRTCPTVKYSTDTLAVIWSWSTP
jgi:hypothetical protein